MFLDLVKHSRSYRGYDPTHTFTKEDLMGFIEHTRYAPSSTNLQPFQYYLVYQPEEVAAVQALTKWAGALPQLSLPYPDKCPTGFIVICQNTNWAPSIPAMQKDVGIVAQTMILAAAEQGLGGCMIGNFSPAETAKTLSLAENVTPVLIVALGKPDETIVIVDAGDEKHPLYYRDEADVHYVPKRTMEQIIISK